jgi:LAO/AO transport system kinase
VIAIDPSSPFTGGAILGDRIRMNTHATDDGVFIRSMASRGAWGGLSQAAADAALVLDAAGRDVIIVETVGVGQDEIEIVRVADCTLVVVTPGSGDEVQSLKAGLMEIADIFVLNKADNPETDRFEQQLLSALQLAPPREGWNPKAVRTVATEDRGVVELISEIDAFRQSYAGSKQRQERQVAYWKSWLLRSLQHHVTEQALQNGRTLDELAAGVAARHKEPHKAAEELMSALGFGWKQSS